MIHIQAQHSPYSYKRLIAELTHYFSNGGRKATYKLNGLGWTLKLHGVNGRLKKEKWHLSCSDGTIRSYRRLNQVFNYIRTLAGAEPEEDPIDKEIRRLIQGLEHAPKTESNS